MRHQTITRYSALALLLVASLTPPAVPAQTQERRALPAEVPIVVKSECPNPVNNVTLTVTTPYVYKPDFPQSLFTGGQQFAGLNDSATDKPFLNTFQWGREERCCQISKALLTVKMRANQGGPLGGPHSGNDGIAIMHSGSTVSPFNQAVYNTPPPVTTGQQVIKQWWVTGTALSNLNTYRRLSIYIQDDTKVESATLQLWGCCLSGSPKGVADASTAISSN